MIPNRKGLLSRLPWLFFSLLLVFLTACHSATPLAKKGKIELSAAQLQAGQTALLRGEWYFWPGQLLNPAQVQTALSDPLHLPQLLEVPQLWSRLEPWDKTIRLITTGTLALQVSLSAIPGRLALRIPNAFTATKVNIDQHPLAAIGTVGSTPKAYCPSNGLAVAYFEPAHSDFLITLQVANFAAPYTGTWEAPTLGTATEIHRERQLNKVITSLIAGALLFMGLYHLFLFAFRTEDKTTLVFGIICLLMAVRDLITGERILLAFFPPTWAGWQAGFVVEHLSAHLTVPLFYLFFYWLFPRRLPRWSVFTTAGVAFLWAILEIFTPAMFHQRFLSWYEYFLLAAALLILFIVVRAFFAKVNGAGITLIGLSVLIASALNDVLLSNRVIQGFYLSSVGMFFYAFSQSILLSRRFSSLYRTVARQTENLRRLNLSLERFIPHEVLEYLEKESILDIQLGDFSERRMAVLFLDIRDFTSLSESLTPKDNFRFVNSFLKRIGPLIRENGGFVDKYLGDGFMALFPGESDSALNAALAIRFAINHFNDTRQAKGRQAISVGIGIHTGFLMLGTIGENRRMDSTVISDTVNTASRLEALTKVHQFDILISDEIVQSLMTPERYQFEFAGAQDVKGKRRKVEVYKLLGTR